MKQTVVVLLFAGLLSAQVTYKATQLSVGNCPFQIYHLNGYPDFPTAYATKNPDAPSFESISNPSTELALRYYATGSTQSILVQSTSSDKPTQWALYADGVVVGTATASAPGPQFQTISVTGLDVNEHLYQWWEYGVLSGTQAILTATSSGKIDRAKSVAIRARPCLGVYGDSNVDLRNNGAPYDSRLDWTPAAWAVGLDIDRMGAAGQPISGALENETWAITSARPLAPSIVFLQDGANDQRLTKPLDAFQASVLNELTQMAAAMPRGGRMIRATIPPNSAANYSQVTSYNAAIVAATTAYNASNPAIPACIFDEQKLGLNTAGDTVDGSHLVAQNPPVTGHPFGWPLVGFAKITNPLSLVLAGYTSGSSVTLSGPADGFVGAKMTLTVAPAVVGAAFSSGETFTVSDGGAGGVFTDSDGETGTGTITVHTAPNSTSLTLDYTSTAAGAYLISLSGMPSCYTAPAPLRLKVAGVAGRRPVTP